MNNVKIVEIKNSKSDLKENKKIVVAKKNIFKEKKSQIKFSQKKSTYAYRNPDQNCNFFKENFYTKSTFYNNLIPFFSKPLIDKLLIKTKYIESKTNQYFVDFDFCTISFHSQFSVRPPPFV